MAREAAANAPATCPGWTRGSGNANGISWVMGMQGQDGLVLKPVTG